MVKLGLIVEYTFYQLHQVLALKRLTQGAELKKHTAQGPNIRFKAISLAGTHLGRQVIGGADQAICELSRFGERLFTIITLEMPKSPILRLPFAVRNMLLVLRSLCSTLFSCKQCRAITIYKNQFMISFSSKHPLRCLCNSIW